MRNVAFLYKKWLFKQSLFLISSQLFLFVQQKCFEWPKKWLKSINCHDPVKNNPVLELRRCAEVLHRGERAVHSCYNGWKREHPYHAKC